MTHYPEHCKNIIITNATVDWNNTCHDMQNVVRYHYGKNNAGPQRLYNETCVIAVIQTLCFSVMFIVMWLIEILCQKLLTVSADVIALTSPTPPNATDILPAVPTEVIIALPEQPVHDIGSVALPDPCDEPTVLTEPVNVANDSTDSSLSTTKRAHAPSDSTESSSSPTKRATAPNDSTEVLSSTTDQVTVTTTSTEVSSSATRSQVSVPDDSTEPSNEIIALPDAPLESGAVMEECNLALIDAEWEMQFREMEQENAAAAVKRK